MDLKCKGYIDVIVEWRNLYKRMLYVYTWKIWGEMTEGIKTGSYFYKG